MRPSSLFFSAAFFLLSTTGFASVLHDTSPVDCLQSEWSDWMKVGYNTRSRSRVILRHPSNGGIPCGPGKETQLLRAGETITSQETAQVFLRRQTDIFRDPYGVRDLLIILDESGSIGAATFEDTKRALASVLGYICPGIGPSGNQVAFMTFSSRVTEHFDFDDYRTYGGVIDAILRVPYSGGGTETQRALDYARTTMFNNGDFSSSTKGLRPGTMKEVLLITDGPPNDLPATVTAAERLRNIGVDVFALGIGNIDFAFLEQLISYPQYPHIFHLSWFDDQDFLDIVEAIEHSLGQFNVPCTSPILSG